MPKTPSKASLPLVAAAALSAVLFWSFKPIIITEIGDSARYVEVYLVAGGIAVAVSLIACLLQPGPALRLLRADTTPRAAGLAAISGLCLAVWYYGFYRALYGSGKVDATIIAFAWPLIAVFAMRIFAPEHGRALRWPELALIGIAFLGAVAIGISSVTEAGFTEGWEIGFAFVAALGSGFYLPFAIRASTAFTRTLGSGLRATFFAISIANLVALLAVAGITYLAGTQLLFYAFDARVIALCAVIGIGTYLVAEVTWTWAFGEYQSLTLSSLAFFSPALSVVMLYAFYGERVDALSAYGLTLILFANMTLHGRYQSGNALIAALIGTLYVALAALFLGTVAAPVLTDMLYFISGLFAILAGFVLSRVSSRRAQELDQRAVLARGIIDLTATEGGVDVADDLLTRLIDIEFEPTIEGKGRIAGSFRDRIPAIGIGDPRRDIATAFDLWFAIHRDRLSLGEKVALWITGGTSILFLILISADSLYGQLGLYAFSAGCLLVIFTISDYERNNVLGFRKQILRMQEAFQEIGRLAYVPRDLIHTREVVGVLSDRTVRARGDDGEIAEFAVPHSSGAFRSIYWLTAGLLLTTLVFLPFAARDGLGPGSGRVLRPDLIEERFGRLFRDDTPPIAVAAFDWPASQVVAEILAAEIEARFGTRAVTRPATVDGVFRAMVAEEPEIDIHADFWRQNQPQNEALYIRDEGSVALNDAPYLARQGVYLPRSLATSLRIVRLADLADPDIAARFDADGDGLGEIWIGADGWRSTDVMRRKLAASGLDALWEADVFSDRIFKAKLALYVARDRPIVFYGYEPDWIHASFDLVRLEEPSPKDDFCLSAADLLAGSADGPFDAPACQFPPTEVHVAYATRLTERDPEIAHFVSRVRFRREEVNGWLERIARDGLDAGDVGAEWRAANAARLDGWAAP
ncbi:MAG: glycine betaine ABC transporter substrate-binding protein [Jannaschia sp.]